MARSADVSFVAALAVTAIVLSPPVDRIAQASQALSMAQHMLLAFLVAPLLVKGEAVPTILNAVPRAWGGRRRTLPGNPAVPTITRHTALFAWITFVFTLIAWHFPRPVAWASGSAAVRVGEQFCFVGSGTLFWSMLLKVRGRRVLGEVVAVVYCASAVGVTDLVGAVMTLSQRLICPANQNRAVWLGLSNLQDQQLAGLLMWIPGTVIMLTFFTALFPAWLKRVQAHAPDHSAP